MARPKNQRDGYIDKNTHGKPLPNKLFADEPEGRRVTTELSAENFTALDKLQMWTRLKIELGCSDREACDLIGWTMPALKSSRKNVEGSKKRNVHYETENLRTSEQTSLDGMELLVIARLTEGDAGTKEFVALMNLRLNIKKARAALAGMNSTTVNHTAPLPTLIVPTFGLTAPNNLKTKQVVVIKDTSDIAKADFKALNEPSQDVS